MDPAVANYLSSLNKQNQDAQASVQAMLNQMGLGAMSASVWQFIVSNPGAQPDRIMEYVYQQPAFKERFPAMAKLQAEGRAISPAQYIAQEQQYADKIKQYGVADFISPGRNEFATLIENNVSPSELEARLRDGYAKVANADPAVRDAFGKYFGVKGDNALASYFLDPARSADNLTTAAQAAEVGGAALSAHLDIGYNEATQLAKMGVSYQQAMQGMDKVQKMSSLFDANAGEAAITTSAAPDAGFSQGRNSIDAQKGAAVGNAHDELGVSYVFGTDAAANAAVEQRLKSRVEEFSQPGSKAVVDNKTGTTGFGSAQ